MKFLPFMAAALALAATPMTGRAAFPAALAALGPLLAKVGSGATGATKAGGAAGTGATSGAGIDPAKATEAAEKRQEQIEKQWDLMIKLNKDVKDLIDLWKPPPAAIKTPMENLEAVEKALGAPLPAARSRSHLDGTALFAQPTPALPPLPAAVKESERPARVIATAQSAGTRLRAGATRPPVLLPTASSKPPVTPKES